MEKMAVVLLAIRFYYLAGRALSLRYAGASISGFQDKKISDPIFLIAFHIIRCCRSLQYCK
jgi:hypothetical protein